MVYRSSKAFSKLKAFSTTNFPSTVSLKTKRPKLSYTLRLTLSWDRFKRFIRTVCPRVTKTGSITRLMIFFSTSGMAGPLAKPTVVPKRTAAIRMFIAIVFMTICFLDYRTNVGWVRGREHHLVFHILWNFTQWPMLSEHYG